MNKLLSVALCLLVLIPFHAEATQFQYNQDMECDYPVSADIKSISCDGSDTCRLGDKMVVYGSITLEESLPSSTLCTTVKSCFLGFPFLCKTHLEKVDVCEELGMSSNNGATACPSAGSFYFDYTLQLPTRGDWLIVGSGTPEYEFRFRLFFYNRFVFLLNASLNTVLYNRMVGHCIYDNQ